MELPEIAGRAGTMDDDRIVYIEEYVLQYLKIIKQTELAKEDKFLLYGKKEKSLDREIYIIYGICRQEEWQHCLGTEGKDYYLIGSLDMEILEEGDNFCRNIMLGNKNGGQPAGGYYVFYHADDKMKERLGEYYEENRKHSRYIAQREETGEKLAELVALSNEEQCSGAVLYIWIRMAAIGILIIFCAIAVVTINGYEKMNDFVQIAVQTAELMEEP